MQSALVLVLTRASAGLGVGQRQGGGQFLCLSVIGPWYVLICFPPLGKLPLGLDCQENV